MGDGTLLEGLGVGLSDQAYQLHLRGMSARAIGARLGINKTTAARYVKQVERELAPRRRAAREQLQREAIARLRGVALEAADRFDQMDARDARGAAALLNIRLACEREIARLYGLYEHVPTDSDDRGITITISRWQPPISPQSDMPEATG